RVAFGPMVRLVISDNEGSTTVVPLLRDEVTIGRKEGNTIRLTERNISRRHVQLIRMGGIYKLRDLDSYNGVLVNGRKVEGESTITSGDQIQLGDYTILVEEEATVRPAPAPAALPAQAQVPMAAPMSHSVSLVPSAPAPDLAQPMTSRRPTVPARIVMLTPPASGAEFVLPTEAAARLGRSDEVDCPINHRSVSREHAEIRPMGDQFVIEDLGSANGVTINGRTSKKAELRSGDIIELGQVVFRFVAAGEHYFFDPGEAARFRSVSGSRSGANTRLAILLGVVTLAALVFMLLPTPDAPQGDPDANGPVILTESEESPEKPSTPGYEVGSDDGYDKAVLACRSALAASRFVEAAAHAQMALKARPTSSEALDCKARADSQSMEEQGFVRGKDALARGDALLAYQEFSRLPEHSAFRSRPEVQQAMTEVANKRLEEARQTLPTSRGEAARLAQSVLGLPGVTSEQINAAETLIAEARGELTARSQQQQVATVKPTRPAPAPQRSEPVRVAEAPRQVSKPAPPPPAPVSRPAPTTPAPSPTPSGVAPMEIANACLARGDNECVIRALDGNARTQQELGLLIETYRAVGDVKEAQKNMATYVKRFPDAARSAGYRRMLELQGQ
ncbi:MAG TPA: FHA domain-containing protein, partial [Polyangiales bacterium]|nr:FHA domain-containing protein [Polyangiales bacterium]